MKRFVFIFGAVLLVLVASVAVADEVPSISARDLISLYRENEIRFNRNYLNKTIQVRGVLDRVNVSKGEPTLGLEDGSFLGMYAYCLASELDAAADLDKGDLVVVVGKCEVTLGKVVLRGCVIQTK
jgi:hypothetical protein